MNEDIISYIDNNKDLVVDLVHEFFAGKYTKDEVNHFLYFIGENVPRAGVVRLSEEFNAIENKNTESIKNWYKDTDFYVFDLLPWNGCSMFRNKLDGVARCIKHYNFGTIIDFGGGISVASIYLATQLNCKVYYVDLKDSITFKFGNFLLDRLNIQNVIPLTDEEFFNSDIVADCIVSLDCFEHLPNMEEIFDKLIKHSNVIIHDSAFGTDQWSPQHVYTPTSFDFANMCVRRNYLPRDSKHLIWKTYPQITDEGNIELHYTPVV